MQTRQVELALAISIILSNLSNTEEYIETLLGVKEWKKRAQTQALDVKPSDESALAIDGSINNQIVDTFDDKFVMAQPETERIIGMLNLLSHTDPFISEQISILLANVSNSPHFKFDFISDRCIKSIIKILRFKSQSTHDEVSLLAILIVILNLSAMEKIVAGIENMQFLGSLQYIIRNDRKPLENRSIGLMAISNIFTLTKSNTKTEIINSETRDFAFEVLRSWHSPDWLKGEETINDDDDIQTKKRKLEDADNREVIKNLVYASLILFYNILLKDQNGSDGQKEIIINRLIEILNNDIMDYFDDPMIVNVVLQLITLFTRREDPGLFNHEKILNYVFSRLSDKTIPSGVDEGEKKREPETVKLAALALSRLSSRFDASKKEIRQDLYIKELEEFDNFEYVMAQIRAIISKDLVQDEDQGTKPKKDKDDEKQIAKDTLKYLLNVLENITSEKITREKLQDCNALFKHVIDKRLFTGKLELD
jgi:hypothetical protein